MSDTLNFAEAFRLEVPSAWRARDRVPRGPRPVVLLHAPGDAYLSLSLTPGSQQSPLPVEAIVFELGSEGEAMLELELPSPHESELPFAHGTRRGQEPDRRIYAAVLLGEDAGLFGLCVHDAGDEETPAAFRAAIASARPLVKKPWWKFW